MIDQKKVEKAAAALIKHLQSQGAENSKTNLFAESDAEERTVNVQVGLKRIPKQARTKPYAIPLVHSLHRGDSHQTCLFLVLRQVQLRWRHTTRQRKHATIARCLHAEGVVGHLPQQTSCHSM